MFLVVSVAALLVTVPVEQAAASCLLPPVTVPIVDHFREPPCRWCPGNRGLTYRVRPDTVVRAAAAGTVTFSGLVAGTRYVVVAHAGGLRATYGGLDSSDLRTGDVVAAGTTVGFAGGELHFGLRDGERYVDPEPLLGRIVHRARLVPTDGTAPRPAPPPRLRCPGGTA